MSRWDSEFAAHKKQQRLLKRGCSGKRGKKWNTVRSSEDPKELDGELTFGNSLKDKEDGET